MKKIVAAFGLMFFLSFNISNAQEIAVGLSFGESQGMQAALEVENLVIKNSKENLALPNVKYLKAMSCNISIVDDLEFEKFEEAFINSNKRLLETREEFFPVFIDGKYKIGKLRNIAGGDSLCLKDSTEKIYLATLNAPDLKFSTSSFKFKDVKYEKDFSFYSKDTNLSVINHLDIEKYLYGVVPKEMSASWEMEALKAQAVVARNYAYSNLGRYKDFGFDICITQNCQVYGGVAAEKERSSKAVDETNSDLLMHEGKLIEGCYHASSGGQTANSENVWNTKVPYLRSVSDPYSLGNKHDSWKVSFTAKEIEDLLIKDNQNIGKVLDVQVKETSNDFRVLKLEIIGDRGSVTYEKENIRKFLGYSNLKSTMFTLEKTSQSVFPNDFASISKLFTGEISLFSPSNNQIFTLNGKGWGHGIGMSQYGAKSMAEKGFNYQDILKYYYKDSYITKKPS